VPDSVRARESPPNLATARATITALFASFTLYRHDDGYTLTPHIRLEALWTPAPAEQADAPKNTRASTSPTSSAKSNHQSARRASGRRPPAPNKVEYPPPIPIRLLRDSAPRIDGLDLSATWIGIVRNAVVPAAVSGDVDGERRGPDQVSGCGDDEDRSCADGVDQWTGGNRA
jgi:hypothetical protein